MMEIRLNKECNYVHLLSGGLDSAYSILGLSKKLEKEEQNSVIHPIFFDYGHYAANVEWERVTNIVNYIRNLLSVKSLIDDPVRISLKSDLFQWCKSDAFRGKEGERTAEIENRNMVLFSVLASYLIACANHQNITYTKFEISSGFKEGELKDCTEAFFGEIAKLLSMYKKNFIFNFRVMRPITRQEIYDQLKTLLDSADVELGKFRELTISCYSPTDKKPCGICSKCCALKDEKRIEKEIENKINKRFST